MFWFRLHSRLGAGLALFALVIQLALSFGHIHLEIAAGSAPAQVAEAPGKITTAAPDPARGDAPAPADDYCALCALIQLAGSLVTPDAPPLLPPPTYRGALRHLLLSDFNLSRAPPARSLARAPPPVA